jgi:hypothetical protein
MEARKAGVRPSKSRALTRQRTGREEEEGREDDEDEEEEERRRVTAVSSRERAARWRGRRPWASARVGSAWWW